MAIKNRSANLFDVILSDFKARFARVSKDFNSVQEWINLLNNLTGTNLMGETYQPIISNDKGPCGDQITG